MFLNLVKLAVITFTSLTFLFSGCTFANHDVDSYSQNQQVVVSQVSSNLPATLESSLPVYTGYPYAIINNNIPLIDIQDAKLGSFENYSPLDSLNRCGVAYANISKELMPTGKREPIGQVKPSGWHTQRYDNVVPGKYLYNRCHLIGFQLAGENANPQNLITGTRYLNNEAMLPFENQVANYVQRTGNHVLYRVTPVFIGNELVARGVYIEALSVEDNEICFYVYCFNVQPNVVINYVDGTSHLE